MNNEVNNANNKDAQLDFLIKSMAEQQQSPLPSSGLIWWRAQVLKKLEAKERIERPMAIMRMLVAAVGAVLLLGLVVINWLAFHGRVQQGGLILLLALAVVAAVVIALATNLRAFRA